MNAPDLTPEQIRAMRYKLKADRPKKLARRYSKRMEMAERAYQERLAREITKYI